MDDIGVTFPSERPGGEARLGGRLHLPAVGGRSPGVLLCHPHPMGGGSQDVPLIQEMAGLLAEKGIAALRFNFGGVGASEGVFSGGVEEPGDVRAGLVYLESLDGVEAGATGVVGWSFGAWMALVAAAEGLTARSVVAIAPPLLMYGWEGYTERLASSPARRRYIVGDGDQFCPREILRSFAGEVSADDLAGITVLADADHFLMGREREVALLVARVLA